MTCGAGCMGGKIHKTQQCVRLKRMRQKSVSEDANIVEKNGVVVQTRGRKKRWRLLAAPTHKAEVWTVKTEREDGVLAETAVLVGPAFPGTLLPVQGSVHHIKRVAKAKVEVEGMGFVPEKEEWGSLDKETWKKFAASPCAWSRLFAKTQPQFLAKTKPVFEPHIKFEFKGKEGPIAAQMPPITFERNKLVRCAYCGTAYKTKESYAQKCAPDFKGL